MRKRKRTFRIPEGGTLDLVLVRQMEISIRSPKEVVTEEEILDLVWCNPTQMNNYTSLFVQGEDGLTIRKGHFRHDLKRTKKLLK